LLDLALIQNLLFDFTGSADQTKGPANIRPTIVRAACCYLLTCLTDPALAINYGLAKVIDIKVREGSVVNPRFPAPVNTYNPTVHALVEALLEASSQITPRTRVGDGLQQPLDHHRRPQQQNRQKERAI
jgi:N-methylhydantoinase B